MRVLYSFVIDENPRFLAEGRIFLRTILRAGVAAGDVVAQVTARSGHAGRDLAASFGVRAIELGLGPDGACCNKINQLFTLDGEELDVLVCCDTDIAILRPLEEAVRADRIRAKRVDQENPPLAVLERIREFLGVAERPPLWAPGCAPAGRTYAMNCNGGVLMIPRQFVRPLREAWLGYATVLSGHRHLLEQWVDHIDQVSWAFAMLKLQLPFEELPVEYNFPTNIAKRVPRGTYTKPAVLHYHRALDRRGRLRLSGIRSVDESIQEVNRLLRDDGGPRYGGGIATMTGFHGRWPLAAGGILLALATVAGALGAHTLKAHWGPQRLDVYDTAVRYQFYHSLGLLGIGLTLRWVDAAPVRAAAVLVATGVVLFSGSLYALTLGAPRVLGVVTPIGGLALIAGWVTFAYGVWRG